MNVNLKNASIVGIIPAILEGILIFSVEPTINLWLLSQAILFWFTCGFVVYLVDVGLPKIISGILFTMFLSLPWYIAESVSKDKPEHLVPLILASIVLGIIIGIASKKLNKTNEKNK
ncbi:MAG: hypothetical protein HOO91_21200 [Bacteroidales bacterium]|nr:hypothetical protein [Bacteroidales bacterium]